VRNGHQRRQQAQANSRSLRALPSVLGGPRRVFPGGRLT
jgi:hypothetical protein